MKRKFFSFGITVANIFLFFLLLFLAGFYTWDAILNDPQFFTYNQDQQGLVMSGVFIAWGIIFWFVFGSNWADLLVNWYRGEGK